MLKQFDLSRTAVLEPWHLELPPASVTVCHVKTGKQLQEPSWAAVRLKTVKRTERSPRTGELSPVERPAADLLLAAGRAALEYRNAPGTAVFSPFRRGQIVQFPAAALLIKSLLGRIGPKLLIPKPVICVRIQEHTTQVEEQALAEAAIQCGARKVFLYTDSLPATLECARGRRDLQNAVLIHIEPQE